MVKGRRAEIRRNRERQWGVGVRGVIVIGHCRCMMSRREASRMIR
jgi:hypothetical protein